MSSVIALSSVVLLCVFMEGEEIPLNCCFLFSLEQQQILTLEAELNGFKKDIQLEQEANEKLTHILKKCEDEIDRVRNNLNQCMAKQEDIKNEASHYMNILKQTEDALAIALRVRLSVCLCLSLRLSLRLSLSLLYFYTDNFCHFLKRFKAYKVIYEVFFANQKRN